MAITPLVNASFETGDLTGWTASDPSVHITTSGVSPPFGTYECHFPDGLIDPSVTVIQTAFTPSYPGQSITASCYYHKGPTGSGANNNGRVMLVWYDEDEVEITPRSYGNAANSSNNWQKTSVTAVAPAGTAFVRLGIDVNRGHTKGSECDNFAWNHEYDKKVALTYPLNGSTYAFGAEIPFRVAITGGTTPAPTSVTYTVVDTLTSVPTVVGTSTTAPFAVNYSTLPAATYTVTAAVTFDGGNIITSPANAFTVGTPPDPDSREFRASNAYTLLVAQNFEGLSSSLPPTAIVTGCQMQLDYYVTALIRAKDFDVGPSSSRYEAAFEMVPSATFSMHLLDDDGDRAYRANGTPILTSVPIDRSVYTVLEDGTSEEKRWTVLEGDPQTATVGSATSLFGANSMPATDFGAKAIGLRFTPDLAAKPDYADSGDACFRVAINKMRFSVYFDAGSVEYYFASPDKSQVIKGELAAFCVDDGAFSTGDATGDLQLAPDLEVMDGTQTFIGSDWTIHAQYPPTDINQIGDVAESPVNGTGMSYNGLPGYNAVVENRSRYQFITANFYGDKDLDSIYGAHGLPRAFAYNGDFFYKICTQPDPVKDSPRHVAYHHAHLALGYSTGNVDISVVGEPYNFNGALGASSWTIGDKVTGLLPLSGTILGVFGSKSVWGINGTTVDNFSTQVITPNVGAIEYTICDMGYPVYANSYGVYTLSQTQQYGDFLGTPMSQDISPWLRPRLLRKKTSNKEVVCAWPVRSKNQYRLAFSDGYITSMTLNGAQATPTFSLQKYFWDAGGAYESDDLWAYPGMVPAAVSSQLDVTGEERIHIAPTVPVIQGSASCASLDFSGGSGSNDTIQGGDLNGQPAWLLSDQNIQVDFYDNGNWTTYRPRDGLPNSWVIDESSPIIYGEAAGRGTLRQSIGDSGEYNLVCVDWTIPPGV